MKTKIKLKIILPPILCLLVIIIAKIGIDYFPLSFGIIIGIVNWNKHKYGLFISIVLSILASYLSFFSTLFLIYFVEMLQFFMGETGVVIVLTILTFIVAPLLVFLSYKFLFHYKITKLAKYIVFSCFFFLVTLSVISDYFAGHEFSRLLKRMSIDKYSLWQLIVAFSLQLLIYQKEIYNNNENNLS